MHRPSSKNNHFALSPQFVFFRKITLPYSTIIPLRFISTRTQIPHFALEFTPTQESNEPLNEKPQPSEKNFNQSNFKTDHSIRDDHKSIGNIRPQISCIRSK